MKSVSMLLAATSGLLLAAAFPAFDLHPLAWIALIPLFFALHDATVKNGFWLGGISGLVFFAGTISWVENSVHFYGGISLIPALFITLLLCASLSIYMALFGAALAYVGKNNPPLFLISAPALWTTFELARAYTFFNGFPWSLLGYSQYSVLPVIQIADITGVYGVSFLIVMVNAALAAFIMNRKQYACMISAAVVMALVLGYGYTRLKTPDQQDGLTISVIQGNIEQDKKWNNAYQAEVISTYKRLTLEAIKHHPDLVIWPETATPFYFGGTGQADSTLSSDLEAFTRKNNVPLLFGSPTYQVAPDRVIHLRNSAFLLSAQGKIEAVYHKFHLVPFGEYVPLKRLLFFVGKMVQAIGDFQQGEDYTVMTIPARGSSVTISTVICYEIIFPELVRQFVNNGAGIITTITNDAWFGRTSAPYQHFSMAVFRAVENRVPVARAANTGISGFIDAKGRILETSTIFTEAHLTRTLTPGREKTLYTRYGDLFAYACVIAALAMLAIKPRRTTTPRKK